MEKLTLEELKLLAEVLAMANVQVGKARPVLELLEKLDSMINSVDTAQKDS